MLFVIIATTGVVLTALVILSLISWRKNKSSLQIKGRYVLITGCDLGFGRATAIQLDKMGACVLATCLTKEGEQSLKSVTSDRLKTFQMDVTNSKQIAVVFEEVKALLDNKTGIETFKFFQKNSACGKCCVLCLVSILSNRSIQVSY